MKPPRRSASSLFLVAAMQALAGYAVYKLSSLDWWLLYNLASLLAIGWWLRARAPRRVLRFTREGRYLVGITLGVGFAAINTGNNLLYLILGMMLSMIVVSGILSEQTLRRLRVERELPRQTFAGRPFLTGIALRNEKTHLPSFSVQVEDVIDGRPLAKKCYFLKVPPGARQHTSYRAQFERRGLYRYEGLLVGTRFPFAFFVKSRRYDIPGELLVLPRIHPVARLPVEARDLLGSVPRPRRGQGREFHGLRDYREGDDARDIHWKRSAREGRLLLREYEREGTRFVAVMLNAWVPEGVDPAEEPLAAELERCVDLAASLLVHFAQRGFNVELRAHHQRVQISPDGRGLDAALRTLALLEFRCPGEQRVPAPGTGQVLLVTHRLARRLVPQQGFAHVFEQG